ncbi:MAG: hypothetical protein SWE60_07355 [Thermodesulfobacteriota bacterium]|nr:hypothetical protein [Thermodesulfobacteriota bacterium]
MHAKARIFAVVLAGLIIMPGVAFASPPVAPPVEGFSINTVVDCEMLGGDFVEVEGFTWTWARNMGRTFDNDGINDTTLPFPGNPQFLDDRGRVAQIRYTEEMQSTDTSFFQFKKGFTAESGEGPFATPVADGEPGIGQFGSDTNLLVEKNYGYVASEASLIANAENKERVGLSIIAAGDDAGLGDIPSLCPWVAETQIPATNEFIAMGSDTSTTSVMVSDTETEAVATVAPELNHTISAVGVGMAQALMKLSLMEGGGRFNPNEVGDPLDPGDVPDLVSETDYSEKTTASGTIDKFTKAMHYHSTIPEWQMPEPWYQLQ